ncbi:hypothetical protein [Algoriphagus boritolerans]
MNATQFLELIQKADHLEKSDILLLKKSTGEFPLLSDTPCTDRTV